MPSNMLPITEIDGNTLEGGGQILRLAMSFSCLLKKPIKVYNIRGGRASGGLKPQHLKGLELARDMCNGILNGAELGSTEITFYPGDIKSGHYLADTQTAGSIGLLFQVALPIALYGPGETRLTLKGGTDCEMAPPIGHTLNVFRFVLQKFGANFDCNVLKRGFYPKGGGEVVFTVPSVKNLKPVTMLDFGSLQYIRGEAFIAGTLPQKMSCEMAQVAEGVLKRSLPCADKIIQVHPIKENSRTAVGNGSGVILKAETDTGCHLGSSSLGKRGKSTYEVAEEASKELLECIQCRSCVDNHTQDQIVIFMALACGQSSFRCGEITKHTQTGIFVAEKLTQAKFTIEKQEDGSNILRCNGFGLVNECGCLFGNPQ